MVNVMTSGNTKCILKCQVEDRAKSQVLSKYVTCQIYSIHESHNSCHVSCKFLMQDILLTHHMVSSSLLTYSGP